VPRFIVLSRFTADGRRNVSETFELRDLRADVEAVHGTIVEQYFLFGEFDVFTVIDVNDTELAHLLTLGRRAERVLLPAIDLALFKKMLTRSTETTGPHRWQVSWPARTARVALRPAVYQRPIARWCRPFTVRGREHFSGLRGPAIFIGNHASYLDGPAIVCALPRAYQRRVAVGAAADRFYVKGRRELSKQGWWQSLAYNMFPISRGGGGAALDHARWLLDRGWSLVIFPEGKRSSNGALARFRVGPALLAIEKGVPVVPLFVEGSGAIRPKGSTSNREGPVTTVVGAPIAFAPGTDPAEATHTLQKAMEQLRAGVHQHTRAASLSSPAFATT
jgi:1-acyl-sn-glycerol-3-phosphate acyltransferase